MASVTKQPDSRIRVTVFGSSGAAPNGHDVLSAPSISYYFPASTKLITLGRGNAAPPTAIDIVVSGSTLSKAHCCIAVHGCEDGTSSNRPLSFSVSDLGSANGTTIRPVVLRELGPAFAAACALAPAEAKEILSILQTIDPSTHQLESTKSLLSQLISKDYVFHDNNDACFKKLLNYADLTHAPAKLAPLTATPIDHRHHVISVGKLSSIIISITDLAFPSFGTPNPISKEVSGTTSIQWSDLVILCNTIKELTATVVAQQQQIINLRSNSLDATPRKDVPIVGSATPIEQSPQQPVGRVAPSSTASGSLPHGSSTATFLSSTSLGSQQAGPSSSAPAPKVPLPATLMVSQDGNSPAKVNGHSHIAATLPDPHAAVAVVASHFAATLIVNDDDVNISQPKMKVPLPPTLQVNYDSSTDDDDSHHVPPPSVTTRETANPPTTAPPLFSVNAGGRGKSDAINALFQALSPPAPKSDPPTEVDEDENSASAPPARGNPTAVASNNEKEVSILANSSLVSAESPSTASQPVRPPAQPLRGQVPATDSDDEDNVVPPPAVKPEHNPLLSDFFRKPTVAVNGAVTSEDDDDDANVAVPAPCKSGGNANRGGNNALPIAPPSDGSNPVVGAKRGRSPTTVTSKDDNGYGIAPPPARGAPQHRESGSTSQGRQPVPIQAFPAVPPPVTGNPRGALACKEDDATDDDAETIPATRGPPAPPAAIQVTTISASSTYVPAASTYVPRGQPSTSDTAAPTNTLAISNPSTTYNPSVATALPPRGSAVTPAPVSTTNIPNTTYVPGTTYIPAAAAHPNLTSVTSAENSVSTPAASPAVSVATPTTIMAKAIWQFKTDLRKGNKIDSAWSSYTDADSAIIEAAHVLFEAANGTVAKKKVQTAPLNATYSVNFREMIQYRNDDENRQRPIRRKP